MHWWAIMQCQTNMFIVSKAAGKQTLFVYCTLNTEHAHLLIAMVTLRAKVTGKWQPKGEALSFHIGIGMMPALAYRYYTQLVKQYTYVAVDAWIFSAMQCVAM